VLPSVHGLQCARQIPDLKVPNTQQWNLTVERRFGEVGLRVSYVGSRTVNLVYQRNLNQLPPSTTPFSAGRRPTGFTIR
jgi:hypothetical protein